MPSRVPESPDESVQQINELEPLDLDAIQDRAMFSEMKIQSPYETPITARDVSFSVVHIESLAFVGSILPQIRCSDCVFQGADLSNATWVDARIVRCEYKSCKATGLDTRGGTLRDVAFTECKMPSASMSETTLQRVLFDSCQLDELDLSGSTLNQVTLRDCQAKSLRLKGAKINALDLRGSRIEQIVIDDRAIKELIIEPVQSPIILESLGASIRHTYEE